MIQKTRWIGLGLIMSLSASALAGPPKVQNENLLSNIHQITRQGARSGEGYFSADGKQMIFQSENEPGNPFYQIYLTNLETGTTQRVSPGIGRTTCSWIHPDGQKVLFSSTHEDPLALPKQQAEIDRRAAGRPQVYAWDYDETYEIYQHDLKTAKNTNLTNVLGYDAESSWSPDGKWIAFASNRDAYSRPLSDAEKAIFENDKSYFIDIYIMDAEGKNIKRLTQTPGYDGGPFFSADGSRIIWRHFGLDGRTADVFSMRLDGSDQKQLTRMGAMSWAPYYHPSGDYLIYSTNKHGMRNFELYIVDSEAKHDPVRVTEFDGFDGLPVFSPDGKHLAWTTTRTPGGASQIFMADWNDALARAALGLSESSLFDRTKSHVEFLTDPRWEGRLTGTAGEASTAQYVADFFQSIGLKPAGEAGTYFQTFDFTAGAELGPENRLKWAGQEQVLNQDWRPLAFSKNGASFPSGGVVFAGYGIVAPEGEGFPAYDSYAGIKPSDVEGRWVMVLRYQPEDLPVSQKQYLARYSSLRTKLVAARELGAIGMIVVSGPNSNAERQLVDFSWDASLNQDGIFAVSISDSLAQKLLTQSELSLQKLQTALDAGAVNQAFAFVLKDPLEAAIEVHPIKRTSRNILARLQVGDQPTDQVVMIGAHLDHLGHGEGSTSRARSDERGQIHAGADDNASGVAAMLEAARSIQNQIKTESSQSTFKKDLVFVAWSGEELGTLGSLNLLQASALAWGKSPRDSMQDHIAEYLNMDMVGRLRGELQIQGVGSSTGWKPLLDHAYATVGLPLTLSEDPYLPTDSTSFYLRGIPTVTGFTGSHDEYHTPRDTADRLSYSGLAQTSRVFASLATRLAQSETVLPYQWIERRPGAGEGRKFRSYLGTIPDYTYAGSPPALRLSGVQKGSPAESAGLQAGDLIIALAERPVTSIYDYAYMLGVLKPGVEVTVQILRDGQAFALRITPRAKERWSSL